MRHMVIGNCAATRVFVILALGGLFAAAPAMARAGTTERVSVASDGTESNDWSDYPSISGDGRFVAFNSGARNLVEGDTNGDRDVFVHDRQTGETTRVSIASDGTQGNGASESPSISSDGRFVAFESYAKNLVEGDTMGRVFVHDRQTGQTTCVSLAFDGTQVNDGSRPSISADGRFVAFQSQADNLIECDTNSGVGDDIFVHDRQTGHTTRVSVDSYGRQANNGSHDACISGDGRFVAFQSDADNLVEGDTNGHGDAFVHDRQTRQTTRISVASDGSQANHASGSYGFSISTDGRFVAFHSNASNLVEDDTNGVPDIFVHDRQTGETTLVSAASDGTQGNSGPEFFSISGNGRFVVFESIATNLVEGDTNAWPDVFVHDRQTGQTTRITLAYDGTEADRDSHAPVISADGRFVTFHSIADNLVDGDTNRESDVFVHDWRVVLTVTTSGNGTGTVNLSPAGDVYDAGTTVTLTAQPTFGSIFDHWEGDLTGSANPTTILMDDHKSVVAHFIYPQLTVLSAPIVDVAITGTRTGSTPYFADCDLHEVVALTAPESVSVGGKTYYFELWFVNNVSVLPSEGRPFNELEVTMDDARTAVAQYGWRLPGDYNDDCTVNILDLLFVRNRLQTRCSE